MITVSLLPADSAGCGFYRCWQPLLELQRRGDIQLIANHLAGGRLRRVDHLPFEAICALGRVGKFVLTEDAAESCDVLVCQKQSETTKPQPGQMSLTDTIAKHRHKTIYELDDNLFEIPRTNPSHFEEVSRHGSKGTASIRELIKLSRLVTVTTPHLADVVRKFNPNVRVVPNGVDLALWKTDEPREKRTDGQIRVAWILSRNHREDVPILIKPWKAIAAKYPNVTFVLAGSFDAELKRALGDRLECHNDGVPVSDYPAWCRALDLDICVAPLQDGVFHRSKSNLKWLEGSALRCPVVCSAVEPYIRDVGPEVVRGSQDWISALSDLIDDADLREACVRQSLETIREKYTMQHSADSWFKVLKEATGDISGV